MRAVLALLLAFSTIALAADPNKILRVASVDIETLDPHQYNDDPSFQVVMAIFEPAYEYDYLAASPKLTPLTAAALPEVTDDGRTWTVKLKPGIYFTDDPAFKGKPRELVAQDYVYSYKRWLDPNGKRGGTALADQIVGARAAVDAARSTGRFDFDAPIDGLQVLDRYTFRVRLLEPWYPNTMDLLGFVGAIAREVVETYGTEVRTHPVGTGPYRLRQWVPASRIVLEANPAYRAIQFPATTNPVHAALAKSMEGKRLPQISVIDISIIEEDLTRLLRFEQGGLDEVLVRGDVAARLLIDGKLKPEYAARGITRHAFAEPFLFALYFHVPDAVVGGMTNERIALRRAIAMALDLDALAKVVYAGQALPANQIVPPGVGGYDNALPQKPSYDPAGARALLDRFGYRRGPEGWRTTPEGRPLTINLSLRTGAIWREYQTLWKRSMDAINVRTEFRLAPFQDIIKEVTQGQFQAYIGGFGGSPWGSAQLLQLYSRQSPRLAFARFSLPEYDREMVRFVSTDSEAERVRAARAMNDIARNYVPIFPLLFRLESHYVQPWVQGFAPPVFRTYWKYLDIDLSRRGRLP